MSTLVLDNKADLAGPGIDDYNELQKLLPRTTNRCSPRGRRNRADPVSHFE